MTQYGIVDDFSWTRGRHSFRFGVNFRRDDVSDHNFTGVIPFAQEVTLNDFAFGGVAPAQHQRGRIWSLRTFPSIQMYR